MPAFKTFMNPNIAILAANLNLVRNRDPQVHVIFIKVHHRQYPRKFSKIFHVQKQLFLVVTTHTDREAEAIFGL